MDFAGFREQLEAARRAEHIVGGVTFSLRLPTDFAVRVAFETHRDALGRAEHAKAFRDVLMQSVVGWTGATASHFEPGAGEEPIEFSADALVALLEVRQDMFDSVAYFISGKLHARREQLENTAKN